MARLSIRLLGGFQAHLDEAPIAGFRSDKARALLAYLATESGRPHARDSLAWLLWPDCPNELGRTNLRSALSNLHKIIDKPPGFPPHLIIERETVQFNLFSDYWSDVAALVSLGSGTPAGIDQMERLENAVRLYQGEFLQGIAVRDSSVFEDWAALKREQFHRQAVDIFYRLAVLHEQQLEFQKAEQYARKMIELEPWNEDAHRLIMRVLAQSGNRSAAFVQYETCRNILMKELGVQPARETLALLDAIRAEKLEPTAFQAAGLRAPGIQTTLIDEDRPVFVGCDPQIAWLDGFLNRALDGRGQIVFLSGSPGSGKTALLEAFAQRALQAHPNLILLNGICSAYTGIGDPYLPFIEMMGQLVGARVGRGTCARESAGRLWALLPHSIRALAELGPDLIDRMVPAAVLLNQARAASRGYGSDHDRLAVLVEEHRANPESPALPQANLFEQVTNVLQSLARRQALMLVIDDMQWADTGSISLLFHLCRYIPNNRILVIGAYRPEEVATGRNGEQHPLEPLLSEFQQIFGENLLELDKRDGYEFLEALLATQPNHYSQTFRQALFQHTNGHPLFTIELLKRMRERRGLFLDETGYWKDEETLDWNTLPPRVEAVISEQINRLPHDLRRVLETACVEGETFTAEVIANVLGMDESMLVRQVSEQLGRRYRLVITERFERIGGRRVSRYRFRHHLFQVYLYQGLDAAERAYLHEMVGNAIQALYREQLKEKQDLAVALAWHFQEAGLLEEAIEFLCIAGRRAEQLSASEEAIVHYQRALELFAHLPDTPNRDQARLGLTMALGAQMVATRGFSAPDIQQIYQQADDICQRLEAAGAPPGQMIPYLTGVGAFYGHRAEYQAARKIYERILVLAERAGDAESQMVANWAFGYLPFHTGQFMEAKLHLERALEVYDPEKHRSLITIFTLDMGVSCLSWLSWTLFFIGFSDQARNRSEEAVQLARQLSHPFSLAVALTLAAGLRIFLFDLEGACRLAEEAISICSEKKIPLWLGYSTIYLGLAKVWQGGLKEGLALAREGLSILRETGARIGQPNSILWIGEALVKSGQREKGIHEMDEAYQMMQDSGELYYAAEYHRIKGDLILEASPENKAEAEACYWKAIEIASQQGARALELRATTRLSQLLVVQGKGTQARKLLSNIFNWYSEGFDTPDLQTAAQLLAKL